MSQIISNRLVSIHVLLDRRCLLFKASFFSKYKLDSFDEYKEFPCAGSSLAELPSHSNTFVGTTISTCVISK